MTTATEQRHEQLLLETAKDRRRREKKDALRRERDLALGEIGREEARGRQQLADRAKRARDQVYAEFNKQMAALK